MMQIPLILSKLPTQNQLSQIFKNFGFENCAFIQENNREGLKNNSEIEINYYKVIDKKWQHNLLIGVNKKMENAQLFHFKIAKQIALIADCNVVCCYYNPEIIGNPPSDNAFLDFAYINQHWYWIDDVESDYAHAILAGGEIKILRCIDREMEYFLEFGRYLPNNP